MRFKIPVLILLALMPALARAQTGVLPAETKSKDEKRSPLLGSPEEEMLRRAEIRAAEDAHKEMLERAEEAARLGDQIRASYEKLNALSGEDIKKLERLEKLARKIRGASGGSDDKERSQSIPDKLGSAVSRIAELSGILKKSVQKTSRLVVSGAVIENTNELIELIQHLRQKSSP